MFTNLKGLFGKKKETANDIFENVVYNTVYDCDYREVASGNPSFIFKNGNVKATEGYYYSV